MMYFVIGVGLLLWLAYKLYTSAYSYWDVRGFPYVQGRFPFGTNPCLSRPTKFLGYELQEIYNKLAGHDIGGFYSGRRPDLVVRDPALIKHILVKDFQHFRDRFGEKTDKSSPLTQHLFSLEGPKWRPVRTKLTPTFTSGKLKLMFELFEVCARRLEKKLNEDAKLNDDVVDMKEIVARFTTDIIGSTAFGLEIDSINNPQEPFREMGRKFLIRSKKSDYKVLITSIFPGLKDHLGLGRVPEKVSTLFVDCVDQTVTHREKNQIHRNDFLNLLIEMKNRGSLETVPQNDGKASDTQTIDMDLNMIAAQCFVFFLAGFETSSTVTTNALYELAFHQDIQDKVRREIATVSEIYDGINYVSLHNMPYLDQVIYETMRKYPTLHRLVRFCTKPYRVPGTKLVIEEGIGVSIPVYSLHHDPQYFPKPERFDPERFSEQNKSSIVPFTYLPFGEGPRNCIGMRFGLLQTKLGIVTMIKNHRVLPTPETPAKLMYKTSLSSISLVESTIVLKRQLI